VVSPAALESKSRIAEGNCVGETGIAAFEDDAWSEGDPDPSLVETRHGCVFIRLVSTVPSRKIALRLIVVDVEAVDDAEWTSIFVAVSRKCRQLGVCHVCTRLNCRLPRRSFLLQQSTLPTLLSTPLIPQIHLLQLTRGLGTHIVPPRKFSSVRKPNFPHSELNWGFTTKMSGSG